MLLFIHLLGLLHHFVSLPSYFSPSISIVPACRSKLSPPHLSQLVQFYSSPVLTIPLSDPSICSSLLSQGIRLMKRSTSRGSSMASQEATDHQEEIRNMERHEVDGREDAVVGAYDDDDEEDDDELGGGGGGRSGCGLGEKKRRLAAEQVRALERSFEADNKLDPERKARIARDLRLHPRQVAVWFQNRRARWKTKQIERDFAALRSRHDALRHECDTLRRDKDALAAEIMELWGKVETQMAVKLETAEERPSATAVAAAAAVYKDGSTDSDSSAVCNEEPSPYSGAAFDHHSQLQPSFTGFTSFLTPSSALSLSFPSAMYNGSHLGHDDGLLAAATHELGSADFFAEEQANGLPSWYASEGW